MFDKDKIKTEVLRERLKGTSDAEEKPEKSDAVKAAAAFTNTVIGTTFFWLTQYIIFTKYTAIEPLTFWEAVAVAIGWVYFIRTLKFVSKK